MEIVKTSIEWAKAEVFSSQVTILLGVLIVLGSLGFWHWGKTDVARGFVLPLLSVGVLACVIGISFYVTNSNRIKNFETAYKLDQKEFIESELLRTQKTINEFDGIVFKVIPCLMMFCALLIVFVDKPIWRTWCISILLLFLLIMLIDVNAKARIQHYHQELVHSKN